MGRLLRWLLPLSFVLLVASGCSLARYGYDAFPWWAMWQIDRYFDVDEEQRLLARDTIDELRAWHQRTQVAQYASFLHQVDERILASEDGGAPVAPADLAQWRARTLTAWPPIVDQLAGPVSRLLTSLKPPQVERLKARIADDNRDMLRKFKIDSPSGMVQARADRIIERAEFFVGKLSSEQKRDLRERVAKLPADEPLRLAEREARQQAFLALIARLQGERPSSAEAERWTRDYLLTVVRPQDSPRRDKLEQAQQAGDALTAQFLNEISDAQRRHLSKRLREFAADFERRAARPK